MTVFNICGMIKRMNERSIIRATTSEYMENTPIADLPEGTIIILSDEPTKEGTILKDTAPIVEKWTDEKGNDRAIGRRATILCDTATQEFSVILPNQEITGLKQSGIEDGKYMILATKESNEE